MNILLYSHSFYPNVGGIEKLSMQFAIYFQKHSDVDLIVVSRTKETGNNALPFNVVRDPSLKKTIELLKWSDVVFENNPCFGMSWPNFILRKPKVVGLQTWLYSPGQKKTLLQRLKKIILSDYNAVVACSKIIRKYNYSKAVVIGNFYDTDKFKLQNTIKNYHFVFVGRLVSDKGADMCIKMLSQLKKENKKNYSLTIIGDGPELKNLQELASTHKLSNEIRFLGFLESNEIANELNKHQYLLVPSRWREPFGIVALEGLACGCIPIVSDGGGLSDAVGEAGVVFKRNSLPSLVTCVLKLIDNDHKKAELLKSASAHLRLHTQEKVSMQYFDIILKSTKK
jgi:glycosyltransferase involved in cell wall biosynthesis